ncbi:MAG: hypothetical protein V9G10_16750 [Candidatus Nanopelagicales bacterium]
MDIALYVIIGLVLLTVAVLLGVRLVSGRSRAAHRAARGDSRRR